MQQSALLLAIEYVGRNKELFLRNFYLKGRRSVEKAGKEGPAAWVIPSDDPRPVECAGLVNLLRQQGVEVHRADKEMEVAKVKYPAGSYVVRMDQPYSRMADMLLDTQYYSTNDPRPYDDTGWTLGALRNIKTVRVTDAAILKEPMTLAGGPAKVEGRIIGQGSGGYILAHNTENTLATLRFRLKNVPMFAAEQDFKAAGRDFKAGAFLIPGGQDIEAGVRELGLTAYAVDALPGVARHPLAVPRMALVHNWMSTQNEGWVRLALEGLQIPYTYISDQALRDGLHLRERFDVILYGPSQGSSQRLVNGMPMRGAAVPWKASELTPNFGTSPDQTDDVRGGMGLKGLMNVQEFVEEGGLFVTIGSNASIPIDYGLVEGVSISQTRELQARGSVITARISDKASPITYGYGDKLAVYFNQAPVFQVSLTGGFERGGMGGETPVARPSGRGSLTDPDIPQGRPYVAPPPKPEVKPGEEPPISEEMMEYLRPFLPPAELRPRVVVRFGDEKELLVSGMLAGGRELANRPAVVDVPKGKGHYLLFANNPMWRQETQGSFFLLFNAALNFDNLGVGRGK
jgi:hypothetical protein